MKEKREGERERDTESSEREEGRGKDTESSEREEGRGEGEGMEGHRE